MLENKLVLLALLIICVFIILFIVGLFEGKKKNEHREEQKKTETPLDETSTETNEDIAESEIEKEAVPNEDEQWTAFVASLPEKIASLPDVAAIKAKAGEDVTQDDIERELKICPDLWRLFAEMVFSDERPSLAGIANLGIIIRKNGWFDSELNNRFIAYVIRVGKNITPKDWLGLEYGETEFWKNFIDFSENLSDHSDEISSLQKLYDAHRVVDGLIKNKYYAGHMTSEYAGHIREMKAVMGKIVARIRNESVTLQGALKVWKEEDLQNHDYTFYDFCDSSIKEEVQEVIEDFIKDQIRETKTLTELEAIDTHGFCDSFLKYWRDHLLKQDKIRRIHEAAQQ